MEERHLKYTVSMDFPTMRKTIKGNKKQSSETDELFLDDVTQSVAK